MARILIATIGSYGDLYPYLAIGTELRCRGHAVTVATSACYREKIEAEGLEFHPVRPDVELENREFLAYVMDARRGSERVVRHLSELVRDSYQDTVDAARSADLILTHPVTFAAVLAAQKLGRPWVSTVLAPISFLSAHDPPVASQAPWLVHLRALGPGAMRFVWDLGRRQTLGWLKPVLQFRKELGIAAGGHPLFEGSHSPLRVLALFSRYLAAPQPDWPPQTVVTGFPFYDRGALAPDLERFLDEGPAPILFTLGSSAVGAAGAFYRESLAAVERLGRRAVFLTGPHPQGLPRNLPAGIRTAAYAPHGLVFPHAAAVVHQGGIGTTAQAIRSGHPMLVMPFGHDQFDNGARVQRLGAGEVIYRSRYRAGRVAAVLEHLLADPAYARNAAELGRKVAAENGAKSAADAVEACLRGAVPGA